MANTPKNEFEELSEEAAPETEFSETGEQDIIASSTAGTEYDWNKAPETLKAPPRVDLNGKIVTIKKASIMLPSTDKPWLKTRAGDKECKMCIFKLFYDVGGQQESYSGIRVFKRVENNIEKYSHPTITRDRNNQASHLLGLYADFKKKDIQETNMKEFMSFLNSGPKVRIEVMETTNPVTKEKIMKNLVKEFINP